MMPTGMAHAHGASCRAAKQTGACLTCQISGAMGLPWCAWPGRRWKALQSLHNRNETLFYKILMDNFVVSSVRVRRGVLLARSRRARQPASHTCLARLPAWLWCMQEMAPIIYTPTVGWVCQNYHRLYRNPRGMYFSARDRGNMVCAHAQPCMHACVHGVLHSPHPPAHMHMRTLTGCMALLRHVCACHVWCHPSDADAEAGSSWMGCYLCAALPHAGRDDVQLASG